MLSVLFGWIIRTYQHSSIVKKAGSGNLHILHIFYSTFATRLSSEINLKLKAFLIRFAGANLCVAKNM